MEIFIFARFHATPGNESAVQEALHDVVMASRKEEGCLGIDSFQSVRDPQLFYIYSRWRDEAAFETHAGLPHTVRFVERVEPLIDHPVEAQRCSKME
jgi:quinol monooxygenase YgiN